MTTERPKPRKCRRYWGGCSQALVRREVIGGARRNRTADLLHAMQALSQLSYDPVIQEWDLGRNTAQTTLVI